MIRICCIGLCLLTTAALQSQSLMYDVVRTKEADPAAMVRLQSRLGALIARGALESHEVADAEAEIAEEAQRRQQRQTATGTLNLKVDAGQVSVVEQVPDLSGKAQTATMRSWTNWDVLVEAPDSWITGLPDAQAIPKGPFLVSEGRTPSMLPEIIYALTLQMDPQFQLESVSSDGLVSVFSKAHPEAGVDGVPSDAKYRIRVTYEDSERTQPRVVEYITTIGQTSRRVTTEGLLSQPGYTATWQTSMPDGDLTRQYVFKGYSNEVFTPADIPMGARMRVFNGPEFVHEYSWNGQFEEPPAAGFSMPIYAVLFVAGGVAIAAGVWVSIRR
ncbi:MAG: hypothetical protein ACK4P3_04675 [Fimbriimonadaceae bacterium]